MRTLCRHGSISSVSFAVFKIPFMIIRLVGSTGCYQYWSLSIELFFEPGISVIEDTGTSLVNRIRIHPLVNNSRDHFPAGITSLGQE